MTRADRLLRVAILTLYTAGLLHLLVTGDIYQFVTPRLLGFCVAACVIGGLLVIAAALRLPAQMRAPAAEVGPLRREFARGALYALFALPPCMLLVRAFLR
ncbi:MAG: DUF1980 domain-containing protein [Firmicutes bacterium]|nr:DUF1980 domain-containing protein [Bacillota bacterium]